MATIYLGRTSGKYYPTGGQTVTVTTKAYDYSNLFKKYKHTFRPLRAEEIWIYKGDSTFLNVFWYNYATLQPGTEYVSAKLDHAEVYVNVIDSTNPLILALHFKDSPDKSKYWKYSEFSGMIDSKVKINISGLYKFEGDEQLFEKLIEENDITNRSLTYELDKTNGRGKPYSDKFSISKQYVNGSGSTGFYKYVHSPINNVRPQKSFVLYNKNLLMKSSTAHVDNIQGQQYTSITVYCSSNNKPLMIEFEELGIKKYLKRIIGGGDTLLWANDKGPQPVTEVTNLLKKIELSLDNKIYVLLEKHKDYTKEEISSEHPEHKLSKYQPEKITVLPENLQVTGPSCYKIYKHYINPNLSESDLPTEEKSSVIFELVPYISKVDISLFDSKDKREQIFFKPGPGPPGDTLYVYFYEHINNRPKTDTVPLMFNINNKFYGPKERDSYFTGWNHIDSITDTKDANVIKIRLDEINKSLNRIDIVEKNNYGLPDLTVGSINSTQIEFKTERVTVKCEQIKPTSDLSHGKTCVTDTSASCENGIYSKYIHKTVNKFELGKIMYRVNEVKYVENNGKPPTNQEKPIEIKHGQNEVEVYYLTEDSTLKYPLLIGIGKQDSSDSKETAEYYKLISTGNGSSKYKWQKDDQAKSKVEGNGKCLVEYLDKINYEVKKVLRVEIASQKEYSIQLSQQPGDTRTGFELIKNGGKEVEVQECKTGVCQQLTNKGYKCFQHQLTKLDPKYLHEIGGLAFTIPGAGGKTIEIQLFNSSPGGSAPNCSNGKNGTDGEPIKLFYNRCMGDVYVFFYVMDGGSKTDNVPLMLWYNYCYYRPCDSDSYFDKWVQVKELRDIGKPCESGDGEKLAAQLDIVNRTLNQIDLDQSSTISPGTSGGYGLPETVEVGDRSVKPDPKFPTKRVTLTRQEGPQQPPQPGSHAYVKIVHRTVNGFTIGDIKSNNGKYELTTTGFCVKGTGEVTISVKNGDKPNGNKTHKDLVKKHNCNTVVAYYSIGDTEYQLPQLIVILKTDSEVSGGTVTGSASTDYGYYILSSKDSADSAPNGGGSAGSVNYEYVWHPVNEQTQVILNDETDFKLLNSVVLLIEQRPKNGAGSYNDSEIKEAISKAGLRSPGLSKNEINLITGKNITVSEGTGDQCLKKYGYKLCSHDFTGLVTIEGKLGETLSGVTLIAGLRFLIPCTDKGEGSYQELTLSEGSSGGDSYLYYKKSKTQVYVYFYQGFADSAGNGVGDGTTGDPRPLMFCYNNNAYKLDKKEDYFKKWTRAKSIKKCECNGSRGDRNDELLIALTGAVRYLNEVDLFKHPGKCDGTVVPGAPVTSTIAACNGSQDANGNTCTYLVQKYQGREVTVRVECQKIGLGEGDGASSECHYKKMIHTHNGIANGESREANPEGGAPGFRLGSVVYQKSTEAQVHYSTGNNKWYPLVRVTTYFYSEDKDYNSPLLVVLEFQKNGEFTEKEYYKLKDSGGSRLSWSKDDSAAKTIGEGDAGVVKYLDQHRYSIRKVVQIEIQKNQTGSYQLKGGKGKEDLSRYSPLNNGNKRVVVTECKGCDKLNTRGYKCFKHDITGDSTGLNMNEIGGLKFTVPGEGGKGIEIPLHENGGKIPQIQYNKCMGDVFVYFYDSSGGTDKIPLMLHFNNKWYKPENRDEYFKKWVCVSELANVSKPCGNGKAEQLVEKLDDVNRALNQIDLDKSKQVGTGTGGYGLPEGKAGSSFNTMRVTLTKQEGPKQGTKEPPNTRAYTRIVHRTVNGFTIGALTYKKEDILEKGIAPNGVPEVTLNVKNGDGFESQTSFTNLYMFNTVVVYYSFNDNEKKLPQLILILKTDEPIKDGEDKPVTGSKKTTNYCYYILSTSNSDCSYYEYTWREVKDQYSQLTLNDSTDFSLLNSAIILLNQRPKNGETGQYDEEQIANAMETAVESGTPTKSPGNPRNDVNRLTGKKICLKEETNGNSCIKKANFKVIAHDISELVKPNGKLASALSNVSLIAGLRFLMPTRDRKDDYKELRLYDGVKNVIHYHKPSEDQNNKICVFFYSSDPRPLLLCFNNCGYAPKDMSNYFRRWEEITELKGCDCKETEGNGLLKALVRVSDFLNPVKLDIITKINKTSRIIKNGKTDKPGKFYRIHTFNGVPIRVKVEFKEPEKNFCYNKYTHTPNTGFRLGNIEYRGECIKLEGGDRSSSPNGDKCITSELNGKPDCKYTAASEVVVYYYKADKDHKNPLLVALKTSNGTYQPYYELQKSDKSGVKKYRKCENSIVLSDTLGSCLEKTLNRILFEISKHLQIIIDQRPIAKLYCPKPLKQLLLNGETVDAKNPFPCEKRKNGQQSTSGKTDSNEKFIPPSYQAKLYDKDGKQLTNGSTPPTSIQVTRVECWQLTTYGYRCYEHQITSVKDVEEIGGLKFYLWDNTSDKGGSGGVSCTSAGGTGATCKELCLYKASSTSEAKAPEGSSCAAVPKASEGSSCPAPTSVPSPSSSSCPAANSSNQGVCANTGQTSQLTPVTTTYTTCKGNVYVYFYGEDPRPLMLCYDGNAYGPRCKDEYECGWVCLPDVKGCSVTVMADGKTECKGLAQEQILKALYRASMFLNPVQLGRTKCAFHHEGKTCPNGANANGDQTQAAQSTPKDPYKYEVHKYNKTCVNVTVAPTDLSCYRQYVHRPEKEGFRLGTVTYEETSDEGSNGCKKGETSKTCQAPSVQPSGTCPTAPSGDSSTPSFCFPYTTSKQLMSVALYYYMYDCSHNYPLIVELQFKGEVSDYYRLECKGSGRGSNGKDNGCKCKTWVKMVDPSANKDGSKKDNNDDACKDHQGVGASCTPQSEAQNCPKDATTTDICELDQDFASNARRIEELILALNMANQVDQVDFMALEAELIAWIERRAYQIRKGLKLPYNSDKSNLIMETDENCHEESVLMYVLGGGAVGVAGGGGWKALVFMLGLLVKL